MGARAGVGLHRRVPVLKGPPNLGKTEHIGGPLHLKSHLKVCHQLMSSPAQNVKASISPMRIREGCNARDPVCPHPALRCPVGSVGSSASHPLC